MASATGLRAGKIRRDQVSPAPRRPLASCPTPDGRGIRGRSAEHGNAPLVDRPRAQPRHPAAAELRHPVEQDRALRVARPDQPGVADPEGSLGGLRPDQVHLVQGQVIRQPDRRRAPRAVLVAVRAVDLEVGASTTIQVGRSVIRVGRPRQGDRTGAERSGEESQSFERLELVHRCPLASDVAIELAGRQGQRRGRLSAEDRRPLLDPGVVAERAFGPAMDPIGLRTANAARSVTVNDLGAVRLALRESARVASVWASFQT